MEQTALMDAVEITRFGPPEVLRVVRRPVPKPGDGDVLIRVAAIGICRPDSLQRRGLHPPPPGASDLPGLEVAGTVETVGANVTQWRRGDAVCALLAGGGYAQFATAPQEQVLPIPGEWTAVEAATLPENMFTAWDNIFRRGRLAPGESILVHGGTSGLGSLTIMLARAFGARALATAGTDEKCTACLRIGAESAFNYRAGDWVPAVMEKTGGRGVDMVLDIVGRDYVQRSIDVLAADGRLVHLATQGPDKLATIDMRTLIQKRGTILASALRWRSPAEKGEIACGLRERVWPLLPARAPIRPLVDSVHPLADAAKVHDYFDGGGHIGKIVLIP